MATINEFIGVCEEILEVDWLTRQKKRLFRQLQALVDSSTKQRQRLTAGQTFTMQTARGKVYVRVMWDLTSSAIEVFIDIENPDTHLRADTEGLAKIMSLALRHGASLEELQGQLAGIQDEPWHDDGKRTLSMQDAVAQAIGLAIAAGPDPELIKHITQKLEGRAV